MLPANTSMTSYPIQILHSSLGATKKRPCLSERYGIKGNTCQLQECTDSYGKHVALYIMCVIAWFITQSINHLL